MNGWLDEFARALGCSDQIPARASNTLLLPTGATGSNSGTMFFGFARITEA